MIYAIKCYFRLGLDSRRLSPFDVFDRIRGGFGKDSRKAAEILAVYGLLCCLRALNRDDLLGIIYCVGRGRGEKKWGTLSYAMQTYYDERTVYRKLAYIKRLYGRLLAEWQNQKGGI